MPRGLGTVQRKILTLLLGGVALGLSGSPRQFSRTLRALGAEWKAINRQALERAIRSLYQSQLISERQNADGTVTMTLARAGKKRALAFRIETMKIKNPPRWDGMWRVVLFDIPERQKKAREALRTHLTQIGLKELQKSVFIHPHPCADEVDFIVELYQLRPFVRQLTAKAVDNEIHLKHQFGFPG